MTWKYRFSRHKREKSRQQVCSTSQWHLVLWKCTWNSNSKWQNGTIQNKIQQQKQSKEKLAFFNVVCLVVSIIIWWSFLLAMHVSQLFRSHSLQTEDWAACNTLDIPAVRRGPFHFPYVQNNPVCSAVSTPHWTLVPCRAGPSSASSISKYLDIPTRTFRSIWIWSSTQDRSERVLGIVGYLLR